MDDDVKQQGQAVLEALQAMNGRVKCDLADRASVSAMVRHIEQARVMVSVIFQMRYLALCGPPDSPDIFMAHLDRMKTTLDTVALAATTLESYCRTRNEEESMVVTPLAAEQLREAFATYLIGLNDFSSFLASDSPS